MIRPRHMAVGLLLVSSPLAGRDASGQAPAQQCIDQLTAPTRDSLTLRVVLTVSAVDRAHRLPAIFQMDVADAIKTYLRLPAPLELDVYEVSRDTSARTAHLALWGTYEATVTPAGRMRGAEIVAGARTVAFDTALLAAMRSIDSTGALSASSQGIPNDLRLRMQLSTREGEGAASSDTDVVVPLFRFRVPLLAVSRNVHQQPGTGSLRYPAYLREAGIQGEALAAFIIGSDGMAAMQSFFAPRTTHAGFVRPVRDALPTFRFTPLVIGGCAVRSIIQQPFTFTLSSTR